MTYLSKWINFWVFLFSLSVLSYSGGLSAFMLLVTSCYILISKQKKSINFKLNNEERIFIYLVLSFWACQVFNSFYQPEIFEFKDFGLKIRALDFPMRWILLLPVFFLLRRYLVNWQILAIGMSIGTLISVVIAHYQVYFLGYERASGMFGNAISFAELMVISDLFLWMLMIYAWDLSQKKLSVFLLFASIAAFYGSLLSVTRGAWLAYVFMILIWLIYALKKSLVSIKYFFSTPVISRIILATIVFLLVYQTEPFQNMKHKSSRVAVNLSQGNFIDAAEGRADKFQTAYTIIKNHPFGVGTDNFFAANIKYRNTEINGEFSKHAHNEFANLWVENGIQGLMTFLLIIGWSFKIFWKNLKHENDLIGIYASCGILLIVSYCIFGLTQSVFSHHSTLIFFIFYLYFFYSQIQLMNSKIK